MKKILLLFLLMSSLNFAVDEEKYGVTIVTKEKNVSYKKITENSKPMNFRIEFFYSNEGTNNFFNKMIDHLSADKNYEIMKKMELGDRAFAVVQNKLNDERTVFLKVDDGLALYMGYRKYEKEDKELLDYLILNEIINLDDKELIETGLDL